MRVLYVEVVATRLHLIDANVPRLRAFCTPCTSRTTPPIDAALKMLKLDRLGHGVGLLPLRHLMFVVPDFLGRLALLEEQQVCADGGIGLEHGIGQETAGVPVGGKSDV